MQPDDSIVKIERERSMVLHVASVFRMIFTEKMTDISSLIIDGTKASFNHSLETH